MIRRSFFDDCYYEYLRFKITKGQQEGIKEADEMTLILQLN